MTYGQHNSDGNSGFALPGFHSLEPIATLTSHYQSMTLHHGQYLTPFETGAFPPFRHITPIGAATSSQMRVHPSPVNPFAPAPLPLDPPTRSPTTICLPQHAQPRQHIPKDPDAPCATTSSSTLGRMFNEDCQQTHADMSSMAFGTKDIHNLLSSYNPAGPKEEALYQRKLRETNLCLKCFSTEWHVPGGRNDPAMTLLFTRYPLL
jgi:hypothetical protein